MSLGVGATHGSSSNGDIMYLICHIISQDHLIDGWEFFTKWPHPDKIGDYGHNDGGDMMFLIRHMISRNDMFKRLCRLWMEAPNMTNVAIGLVQVEI